MVASSADVNQHLSHAIVFVDCWAAIQRLNLEILEARDKLQAQSESIHLEIMTGGWGLRTCKICDPLQK